VGSQELNVCTVDFDFTILTLLKVFVTAKRGEAPVFGYDNFLTAGKPSKSRLAGHVKEQGRGGKLLILRPPQSFNSGRAVVVTSPHRENDLPDVDAGNCSVRLAPCSAHTGLEPIRTGTGQHLVDADDMEWVGAVELGLAKLQWSFPVWTSMRGGSLPNSHMESIFSSDLHKIFIRANARCFKGLGRKLFVLV
jgi:hypothetical protein